MSISLINTSSVIDSGFTTATVTPATALTAGNLFVVVGRGNNVLLTPSDTAGNVFKPVGLIASALGANLYMWYAPNCLGHASNVVTLSHSSKDFCAALTLQYASGGYLDVTANGTSLTSSALTTTIANEVIVMAADKDALATTWTAGSGFTIQVQDSSHVIVAQDKIVSSIQTAITPSLTNSSGTSNTCYISATFTEFPGGGSSGGGGSFPFVG
jgi:hypothetical protein